MPSKYTQVTPSFHAAGNAKCFLYQPLQLFTKGVIAGGVIGSCAATAESPTASPPPPATSARFLRLRPPPKHSACRERAMSCGASTYYSCPKKKKDRKEEVKRHHTATYLIRINGSTLNHIPPGGIYIRERHEKETNVYERKGDCVTWRVSTPSMALTVAH